MIGTYFIFYNFIGTFKSPLQKTKTSSCFKTYSTANKTRNDLHTHNRPNYTTIQYDTLRHNQIYTQFNQNMEPLQTPSPLSTNSDISQELSDLDLFG